MNSPTLCWHFKTHVISGNQQWRTFRLWRLSLSWRLSLIFWYVVIKQLHLNAFETCNTTTYLSWMSMLCLYYTVNVLWYLYDVPTLRCFRQRIWGCDIFPHKQDSHISNESISFSFKIPLFWSREMRFLFIWPSRQCHR